MTDTVTADVVVRNARIFTAADGGESFATGFAVKDGKFICVVSEDAELEAVIGPETIVRDLEGGPVVPGLFDNHIHHVFGGKMLLKEFQIDPFGSIDDVLSTVDAWARNLPEGAWIVGSGWGSTLLPEVSKASVRARLDAVSHGHPALLADDSHHNTWANTAALVAAGIPLDASGNLVEGTVLDAETGEVAGVLFERAGLPVREAQAKAEIDTPEEVLRYARRVWEYLHGFGITAIQDAGINKDALDALVTLDKAGELKGWVTCSLGLHGMFGPLGMTVDEWADYAIGEHRDRVRTTFTKLAADGVPPTQTAGMLTAYKPSPEHGHDHHGVVYYTVDELADILRYYRSKGLHTKIHATGDWSVELAIDAFEILRREGSTQVYQIAHGQFVTARDRKRMAELDIVAEISPFLWYPTILTEAIAAVVPAEIANSTQPNRELLDLGVLVAGGSDWAVVPIPNLWYGIGGLVTRADPEGRIPGTLNIEQAVTVEEALRIFTINGAKAALLDDVVGSIEVGKAANYLLIDRDPFAIDPQEIGGTKVLETIVAGETVFAAVGEAVSSAA